MGAIGSVWAPDTWADDVWADDTWADAATPPPPIPGAARPRPSTLRSGDPFPHLARIPAGAVRESISLLWNQLATTRAGVPVGALTRTTAPSATLGRSADQSIPNAVATVIAWTAILAKPTDVSPLLNLAAFPTRITIPRDTPAQSVWSVTLSIAWDVSAVGVRTVEIRYTTAAGTATVATVSQPPVAGAATHQQVQYLLSNPLGGTYLEARVTQSAGGALGALAAGTQISVVRLY